MRIKVAVAAIVGLLLLPIAADGHVLPMGIARKYIRQEVAAVCGQTTGCVNWKVGPCRRQSYHRIDCLARLNGESGATCQFVVIARVASRSYEVAIHRKRITCF
jgi:hypothetical protein